MSVMSRSRRLKLRRQAPTIDMAPMVDVVFLLIIFFMVSTTFITFETGLPVDLPQAQTAQMEAADLPTVTITRDGAIFLAGAPVTEETLVGSLRLVLNGNPGGVVVLRADQVVPHGLTVRVMDLIRQAGAQRIAIATGG